MRRTILALSFLWLLTAPAVAQVGQFTLIGECWPAALGETLAYQDGLIPSRQLQDTQGLIWEFWIGPDRWMLLVRLQSEEGADLRCIAGRGGAQEEGM